jgi:hypothetical protein
MIIREGLSLELAQSSLYLCDIQFHDLLLPEGLHGGKNERRRPGRANSRPRTARSPQLGVAPSAQPTNRMTCATFQKAFTWKVFVIGYFGR